MKNRFTSFLAGAAATLTLVSAPLSALASDGSLTLTIHPIQVLVNGQVFQPKDAQGNDVLVFTYDGTTYAPLRALAEAYGLEVGYDAENNIATVNGQNAQVTATTPATDFRSQWTVKEKPVTHYGGDRVFDVSYTGPLDLAGFKAWWRSLDMAEIKSCAQAMAAEEKRNGTDGTVTAYFTYNGMMLGTAYAFDGYEQSNFTAAEAWLK